MILCGSLFLYGCAFTLLPNLITDFGCNVRPWLMGVGWVILYGSLFARTCSIFIPNNFPSHFLKGRLKVLFTNKTVEIMQVSDSRLWLIIVVLLFIELVLLSIFQGIVEIEKKIEQPDPYHRCFDYPVCHIKTGWTSYIPIVLLGLFNGSMVIFGFYLSIAVRKIRFRVYNETKILVFSVFLFLLIC